MPANSFLRKCLIAGAFSPVCLPEEPLSLAEIARWVSKVEDLLRSTRISSSAHGLIDLDHVFCQCTANPTAMKDGDRA